MDVISEWIAPILISLAAIIAAVFTCKWQMRTEMRKILENYVSDKKYRAYYNAVDLFYSIMNDKKMGIDVAPSEKFEIMLTVKKDLFVYGSDEAFLAFTKFLCASSNNEQKGYFNLFFNFMLIVRKEISGGTSKIRAVDIMLNLMQSQEEVEIYNELIKNQ